VGVPNQTIGSKDILAKRRVGLRRIDRPAARAMDRRKLGCGATIVARLDLL
jgi:hypothetical protein